MKQKKVSYFPTLRNERIDFGGRRRLDGGLKVAGCFVLDENMLLLTTRNNLTTCV